MFRLIGILLGAIFTSIYFRIDLAIADYFFSVTDISVTTLQAISFWTDYLPVTLYFFIIVYISRYFSDQFSYKRISFIFIYYSFCGLIALILKNAIGRLRPVLDLEPGYQLTNESFKFQFFSEYDWNYASMPSGHSVVVFAMALVLSRSFPRLTILFWFIAIVIAASRIILFQHWLSDILASALLVLVLDLLIWNRLVSWFSIEKAAE